MNRVLVVGGGPTGLAASLAAARAGAEVLVFEAQADPGAFRRGETLRYDPEVEALLYQGFFERHTLHVVGRRRYYSPSGRLYVDRRPASPNRIVSWPDLIHDLGELAKAQGVRVLTGRRVLAYESSEGRVTGVRLEGGEVVEGGFVVAADGHTGPSSKLLRVDRASMDWPVHKRLVRDAKRVVPDRLEYHLEASADGSPPLVGCVFPRPGREAEVLVLSWGPGASWSRLREFDARHPEFAERLEGAEVFYEAKTYIPMGGMLEEILPTAAGGGTMGIVVVGDAAGHVQARGGSGIVVGIRLGYLVGSLAAAAARRPGPRAHEIRRAFLRAHPLVRELRTMHLFMGRVRGRLMSGVPGDRALDLLWPLISVMLR